MKVNIEKSWLKLLDKELNKEYFKDLLYFVKDQYDKKGRKLYDEKGNHLYIKGQVRKNDQYDKEGRKLYDEQGNHLYDKGGRHRYSNVNDLLHSKAWWDGYENGQMY